MTKRPAIDPRRIEVPDPEMVRVLRAKTGAERIQMASDMGAAVRQMLHHSLAARHPDWSGERLQQEVVRRMSLGDR